MIYDLPECVMFCIIAMVANTIEKKTLFMNTNGWPTLQSYCAERWLFTAECVSKSWRHYVGPLWEEFCCKEFPWELAPSRDAYIRWRRLHMDECGPLTPSLPTKPMPMSDRVPCILLVARCAFDEKTCRIVYHTKRPFMLNTDPNMLQGGGRPSICHPLKPENNWHNGMGVCEYMLPVFPRLPSEGAILKHAMDNGFEVQTPDFSFSNEEELNRAVDRRQSMPVLDSLRVDTFIECCGRVAHFECFQFDLHEIRQGSTAEGLTNAFGLLHLQAPMSEDYEPLTRRCMQNWTPSMGPCFEVPPLRPHMTIHLGITPFPNEGPFKTAWLHEVHLQWCIPDHAHHQHQNGIAVNYFSNSVSLYGGLVWR